MHPPRTARRFPTRSSCTIAEPRSIDLSGMSITDNAAVKAKYVFPAGTTIGAGQYLVLYADSAIVAGEHHLGLCAWIAPATAFICTTPLRPARRCSTRSSSASRLPISRSAAWASIDNGR